MFLSDEGLTLGNVRLYYLLAAHQPFYILICI